jgi:hypothetical protein
MPVTANHNKPKNDHAETGTVHLRRIRPPVMLTPWRKVLERSSDCSQR